MNKLLRFSLLLPLITVNPVLQAQVTRTTAGDKILIPVGRQGVNAAVDLPAKGMNRADVTRRFGKPQTVFDPVGQPPISRWHYADFTVYFEHDTVVHSVLRHQPKTP